ncbi:MAG: helix-turn-helix domain-containing protein [Kineosporiaceae bacterium]
MTDEQRLTLEQLAGAVGMTTRNVRAYQTRGLLQPPRRVGRTSVYGREHVQRLEQVQRARERGASLQLLRTLIGEGREIDGVWEAGDGVSGRVVVDVTDTTLGHTPACLARLEVALRPLLDELGGADDAQVRGAVAELVDRGVFAWRRQHVSTPGPYACAAGVLHDQGHLASAAAGLRLTQGIAQAAESVAAVVADAVGRLDGDARHAVSARFGELAAAVTGEVVTARVALGDEAHVG